MESKRKLPLAFWIFVGLLVGIAAGMALMNISVGGIEGKDFAKAYIKPWGDIFLNLLKFVVVPIVLFSIAAGVISMKDISKVGSIGLKTIVYYMCTTAFAVILALILASVAKGMHWFPLLETSGLSYEAPAGQSFMDTIVSIFPSNAVQPLASATMLIRLSPIGVACLICPVVAENGPKILSSLLTVLLVAYGGYIIHAAVVYSSTVKVLAGISPVQFFKGMAPAMMMAFSSASSVGALPFNMECTERLGARREVSSFVLPLGATINMDGTAIYQGVCSVFIASCFGVYLTLGNMVTIVLTATLASIGTAGVPGAGMVMLTMVLQSVNIPIEGIALVAGIDRLFDMGRTTINITGDAACALIVSKMEDRKEARTRAVRG